MLRTIVYAVFLMPSCGLAAHAQEAKTYKNEKNEGYVSSKDYAFSFSAPDGWVLDNLSGAPLGLNAVFYFAGSSWQESHAVMYISTVAKPDTFEKLIEDNVDGHRKRSPELKVTDDEPLPVPDKQRVIVKRFSGDSGGNSEVVAYVEESKVVVIFVLHARTQKDLEAKLPAFRQLIASYHFIHSRLILRTR